MATAEEGGGNVEVPAAESAAPSAREPPLLAAAVACPAELSASRDTGSDDPSRMANGSSSSAADILMGVKAGRTD
jgi:hypothetical protein